jgi:small subunit ribosomal protein S1
MIGETVSATVKRVEPYGVYLDGPEGEIIVLIPDVSHERIPDLKKHYSIGDQVRVHVLKYVPERKLFKGTIKDIL